MSKKPTTIYELFPRYTQGRVDEAIKQLNLGEQRILNLKLTSYKQNCQQNKIMTDNEIVKSTKVIKKVQRYLKITSSGLVSAAKTYDKNLYDFFKHYPKEVVFSVIQKLSDEQLSLLKYRYGEDLFNPVIINGFNKEQRHIFYNDIIPNIKRTILNEEYLNRNGRGPVSIYKYFSNYSKEHIDEILLRLNEQELNLLRLKYGENLGYPQTSVDMSKENKKQFIILRTKIKRMLENPQLDVNSYKMILPEIYGFFRKHKMQNIDFVLSSLNDNEKRLLRVRFAKAVDFYANDIMILREKREIKDLLIKIEQELINIETDLQLKQQRILKLQLEKNKNITEIYKYIVDILHTPEYSFLLDNYSMRDASIILLKFYCEKYYTIDNIAELLQIDNKEVLEICTIFLASDTIKMDEEIKKYSLSKN